MVDESANELISLSVGIKSFFTSRFPHKFVNLFFMLVMMKDQLMDLCGNLRFAEHLYKHLTRDKNALAPSPGRSAAMGSCYSLSSFFLRIVRFWRGGLTSGRKRLTDRDRGKRPSVQRAKQSRSIICTTSCLRWERNH